MLAREFLIATWRQMEGNVALILATGKTKPSAESPHGKLIVNAPSWFHYPTELDAMVEFAEAHADEDLYLTPATYGDAPFVDRQGNQQPQDHHGRPMFSRAKSNALMCATIYMDSDACDPDNFRMTPSRHVDTSEGHGHDWWYLSNPIPASEAAEIAHRITTYHKKDGSDPSGWAENKVLRMPTVNTGYDDDATYGKHPSHTDATFQVSFWETDEVYNPIDVSAIYDDVELGKSLGTELGGERSGQGGVPAPIPQRDDLPVFEDLAARIPAEKRRLNDLLYKVPAKGEKGWQSEQRWALILDCLRFGFTELETASLVWHAPSGSKWRDDARGLDGLWWEITQQAMPVVEEERGQTISAAPIKPRTEAPKLLTPTERSIAEARSDFVSLYLQHVKANLKVYNLPLHRNNAIMLQALAFGGMAMIPKDSGPVPLNFYQMHIAESSEGKGDALKVWRRFIHALYPRDNPQVPSENSKSALLTHLIERDGKVSVLIADEFDGQLAEMRKAPWTTGIQQTWTNVFDGDIPSLGRVDKTDLRKAGITGSVNFHATGTFDAITSNLDKAMFYSGYLARNIFVLGESVTVTRQSMAVTIRRGEVERMYDAMPRYFASRFMRIRSELMMRLPLGQKRVPIDITDEAAARFEKAKWKMWEHFIESDSFPDSKMWRTVIRRMYDNIWKLAALLAIGDSRDFVQVTDILAALHHAERWLNDSVVVAEAISDTFFSRQTGEIEKFIMLGRNGQREIGEIYRNRKGEPPRITDEYLKSLAMQGRIVEENRVGQAHTFRIRKQGKKNDAT